MQYKRSKASINITLNIEDYIEMSQCILIRKNNQKIQIDEYRKRVVARIEKVVKENPKIVRLMKGEIFEYKDLMEIETILKTNFRSEDIYLDEDNMYKAFGINVSCYIDFLKHILKIEPYPDHEKIVRRAFESFILKHNFNVNQSIFTRLVQSVFSERQKIELPDLYKEPFTKFGEKAVEKLFKEDEIKELIEMVGRLKVYYKINE
jgi:type I site-specific restriction endonuclease